MEAMQGSLNWLEHKEIKINVRIRAADKNFNTWGSMDLDNEGRRNSPRRTLNEYTSSQNRHFMNVNVYDVKRYESLGLGFIQSKRNHLR